MSQYLPPNAAGVIVAVLTDAKARIADIARWTTGCNARDINGEWTEVWRDEACKWCADGSLVLSSKRIELAEDNPAFRREVYTAAYHALNSASGRLFGDGFIGVNDERGHAAILAVFDAAIIANTPKGEQVST